MKAFALLISAVLLAAGNAYAVPDAGKFNPTWRPVAANSYVAPTAMTYYPPMTLIEDRPIKPYALVAAPTLPCAPGYCPIRAPRRDRN